MTKVVLCNGCFDILHIGHVMHLREAKSLGSYLIVSLTEDEHVNKGPGRPINTWEHRKELLKSLVFVDEVIASKSCVEAIYKVRPDIFVKGVDYLDSPLIDAAKQACAEVGAELHITRTPKFSSAEIIERVMALA